MHGMFSRWALFSLLVILVQLSCLHATSSRPQGLIPVPKPDTSKPRLRNLATWELGCGLIFAPQNAPLQYMDLLRARESSWFNFLSGDPALTTRLEAGTFTVIIDFKRKLALQEFTLKSFSLEGEVKLYAAPKLNLPGHRSWKAVGIPAQIRPKEYLNLSLGFLETQFLMVVFDVRQGGDISSLSCMGAVDVVKRASGNAKALDDKNPDDDIPFNYARYYEGAKVGYVSGGKPEEANQVLDENFSQPYAFSKDDEAPTMVIDLEDQRNVESLSVLFDGPPGSFDFIFTDKLPEALEKQEGQKASENHEKEGPKATATEPPTPPKPSEPAPTLKSSLLFSPFGVFGGPSLVLAAAEGSLEEAVSLGKLRAQKQNFSPFIQSLPESAQVIQERAPNNADRLHVNFKDISTRYLVVHFRPDEAQNERNKNLNIYQVNLMGDVDIDAVLPEDVRETGTANVPPALTPLIDALNPNGNALDNLDTLVEPPELPVVSP